MGGTSGKFRRALQTGDERAAEEIYQHNSDFQKSFDPNASYGENYDHHTPLHYASRYGMLKLVRIFIQRHNGNPNKRNNGDQTSLHRLCMYEMLQPAATQAVHSQYYSQPPERKRLECLKLLLTWQGITLGNGEREKVDVNAADCEGNTALHYAVESGYTSLVELLLEHGASLFAENVDKETPCDRAEKQKLFELAQYLESKMVFCDLGEETAVEDAHALSYEESYIGMRTQDLQGEKDQLLVETADMLRVPLFTSEALLRHYDWSREQLLEAWISDPKECCESSGVKPPENPDGLRSEHRLSSLEPGTLRRGFRENMSCAICFKDILLDQPLINIPCSHLFCKECWDRYLTYKIQEGSTTDILCPAFECFKLVPLEIIEKIVSPDMSTRYQHFDIKAFVDSNPNLKWCPKVECGRAVKIPDISSESSSHRGSSSSPNSPPPMSRAVDCGSGHFFCWDCCGEPHAPCSCENWRKWNDKIKEIQPESLNKTEEETETAANCLWLVTNSKPCPKCNSPIQKNEGCNHMKCTKCKYDFCWVCLEPWSKHSSATGGYFRCNRYEVVQKVEEKSDELMSEAEKKMKEVEELNRFLHYYMRYRNHGNSFHMEVPLKKNVCHKMKRLSNQAKKMGEETKFIQSAIEELLRARVVLRFSYPYGYYLEDKGGSKQIFEFMQNELEESTETLSQMVARQFLRTPRSKVVHAMHLTTRKRNEFLSAVSKGFLPPDTPQNSQRTPPSFHHSDDYQPWPDDSDEDDEDLRKAIEASIQDVMGKFSPQGTPESVQGTPDSSPSLQNLQKVDLPEGVTDQSTMSQGLLYALEMSKSLLMQQSETPSSSVPDEASPSHSTVQPPQQRKQKSNRSSKQARVRPARTDVEEITLPTFSSYDMDIQKAMALSLQDTRKAQQDQGTNGTSQTSGKRGEETTGSFEHQSSLQKYLSAVSTSSRAESASPKLRSEVTGRGAQGEREVPSRKGKNALKGHGQPSKSSGQSSAKGKSLSPRTTRGPFPERSEQPVGLSVASPRSNKFSTSPVRTSPSRVSSSTRSAPSSSKSSPLVRREASASSHQVGKEPKRQLSLRIESNPSKLENPAAVDNNKSVSQKDSTKTASAIISTVVQGQQTARITSGREENEKLSDDKNKVQIDSAKTIDQMKVRGGNGDEESIQKGERSSKRVQGGTPSIQMLSTREAGDTGEKSKDGIDEPPVLDETKPLQVGKPEEEELVKDWKDFEKERDIWQEQSSVLSKDISKEAGEHIAKPSDSAVGLGVGVGGDNPQGEGQDTGDIDWQIEGTQL
ncbi:ankyrin repeat and IBR domain-containing protein 1-like isoform X2 [Apostichopus japonicus]|uniref:ankyrin repeat and IBR domain-containing protein 1-like isoform X2 n=1 Tax=Stichopus japonicus TaxID=307972 RepID=UPI003AB1AD6E